MIQVKSLPTYKKNEQENEGNDKTIQKVTNTEDNENEEEHDENIELLKQISEYLLIPNYESILNNICRREIHIKPFKLNILYILHKTFITSMG